MVHEKMRDTGLTIDHERKMYLSVVVVHSNWQQQYYGDVDSHIAASSHTRILPHTHRSFSHSLNRSIVYNHALLLLFHNRNPATSGRNHAFVKIEIVRPRVRELSCLLRIEKLVEFPVEG